MSQHTKGEWKVYTDNMTCATDIVAEDGIGFFTKVIAHIRRANKNYEANAQLICEAANACIKVNPDNPVAVAKALPDLYEVVSLIHKAGFYPTPELRIKIDKALAKADGK